MIALRPAHDADGPAIAALVAACFAEYEGCLYEPAEFPELSAPGTAFAGRGGGIWVADDTACVVGSIALAATSEAGVFEIFKLYVAAGARRQGLAGRLLALALDEAAARRARAVRLWSDTRFTDAHRFYARHGFRRLAAERYLADVSRSWEFAFRRDHVAAG